jgi:molybdopterin converting factor subunit 1
MKVRLLLFAVLRDLAGFDEVEIDVADGTRPIDIWNELRAKHSKLAPFERPPFTAVNLEYVSPETALAAGDEVAFIPPVSGG